MRIVNRMSPETGQLPQCLAFDADESARRRLDVGKTCRPARRAVDALVVGKRMVQRLARLDRPVEALDGLDHLQPVEHAVDQVGVAGAWPEARHRLVYAGHRLAELFRE